MELRWLDDFIALAETRHFSRAAERQHVSQPTFSRRIKLLEEEIGVTLIERNSLPLSLTPAGEVFLTAAEQVSRLMSDTKERCLAMEHQPTQRVALAATQALYISFLPDWLRDNQLADRICPLLNSASWTAGDFANALENRQADLLLNYHHPTALWLNQFDFEQAQVLTLGHDYLVPCSIADDDGKARFVLPGQKREPLAYLGYPEHSFLGPLIQQFLMAHEEYVYLRTIHESLRSASVKALIEQGYGMGWLPKRLIENELASGALVPAGDASWYIPLSIRLYCRKDADEHVQQLWQLLQQRYAP